MQSPHQPISSDLSYSLQLQHQQLLNPPSTETTTIKPNFDNNAAMSNQSVYMGAGATPTPAQGQASVYMGAGGGGPKPAAAPGAARPAPNQGSVYLGGTTTPGSNVGQGSVYFGGTPASFGE